MKLLNADRCQPLFAGGNVNRLTKLVEVQGMGLRTRVRLPSGPLKFANPNTVMCSDFVHLVHRVILFFERELMCGVQKLCIYY